MIVCWVASSLGCDDPLATVLAPQFQRTHCRVRAQDRIGVLCAGWPSDTYPGLLLGCANLDCGATPFGDQPQQNGFLCGCSGARGCGQHGQACSYSALFINDVKGTSAQYRRWRLGE